MAALRRSKSLGEDSYLRCDGLFCAGECGRGASCFGVCGWYRTAEIFGCGYGGGNMDDEASGRFARTGSKGMLPGGVAADTGTEGGAGGCGGGSAVDRVG